MPQLSDPCRWNHCILGQHLQEWLTWCLGQTRAYGSKRNLLRRKKESNSACVSGVMTRQVHVVHVFTFRTEWRRFGKTTNSIYAGKKIYEARNPTDTRRKKNRWEKKIQAVAWVKMIRYFKLKSKTWTVILQTVLFTRFLSYILHQLFLICRASRTQKRNYSTLNKVVNSASATMVGVVYI